MEIVKTVKRINALNKAAERISDLDKYFDVWDRILDKKDLLIAELKAYARSDSNRKNTIRRWKNIKLACKLLNLEYYRIMR